MLYGYLVADGKRVIDTSFVSVQPGALVSGNRLIPLGRFGGRRWLVRWNWPLYLRGRLWLWRRLWPRLWLRPPLRLWLRRGLPWLWCRFLCPGRCLTEARDRSCLWRLQLHPARRIGGPGRRGAAG